MKHDFLPKVPAASWRRTKDGVQGRRANTTPAREFNEGRAEGRRVGQVAAAAGPPRQHTRASGKKEMIAGRTGGRSSEGGRPANDQGMARFRS